MTFLPGVNGTMNLIARDTSNMYYMYTDGADAEFQLTRKMYMPTSPLVSARNG